MSRVNTQTAEKLSPEIRQYLIVTGNYWAFTLTDGALRMLVVLHFHLLGYSPLEVAMLFLFYEFFGVVTNLFGGWLGARIGLNRTMSIGLFMQVVALVMLAVPSAMLTVPWVMFAQALSGIAKDLNKMSAKSSIKGLVLCRGRKQNSICGSHCSPAPRMLLKVSAFSLVVFCWQHSVSRAQLLVWQLLYRLSGFSAC